MRIIIWIFIVLVLQSCSSAKSEKKRVENKNTEFAIDFSTGPPITIYKTKKDYSKNVAVGLSDDKSKIISYPHPSDVYFRNKLAYPTKLTKGYLLDNMGINENVAYLNISLEKYSKYENVPSLEELYGSIIDKDPITELYFCGNRQNLKDEISEINKLIDEGHLELCKCLKE